MSQPELRDFLAAVDGFIADPQSPARLRALVSARLRFYERGFEDAPWAEFLRPIVALAVAAQSSSMRDDRLDACAEGLRSLVGLWRGDLGDHVMRAPQTDPAPIKQYKDD